MHSKRIIAAVILVLSFAAQQTPVAAQDDGLTEDGRRVRDAFRSMFRSSDPSPETPSAPAEPAVAGPVAEGDAAYLSGDYGTAVRLWRPLADQGNPDAQFNLGVAYNNGEGVTKNYVTAYMWFTLSAARGDQTAKDYLGIVAREMSKPQIAQAKKLAREWKPRKTNISRRPQQAHR